MKKEDIKTICNIFGEDNVFNLPSNITKVVINQVYIDRVNSKLQILDQLQKLLDEIGEINEEFLSAESKIMLVNDQVQEFTLKDFILAYIDYIKETTNYNTDTYWQLNGERFENTTYMVSDLNEAKSELNSNVKLNIINGFINLDFFKNYKSLNKGDKICHAYESIGFYSGLYGQAYNGIPLAIVMASPNDFALKFLQYIKDNLSNAFISELNKADAAETYKKNKVTAGGDGYFWRYSKSTKINFDWIKESQIISKDYNLNDIISSKPTPFTITFKSIDNCELTVAGIVKVVPKKVWSNYGNPENGFNASIKLDSDHDTCDYKNYNMDKKEDITHWQSGKSIKYKIFEKVKEYFQDIVAEEFKKNK